MKKSNVISFKVCEKTQKMMDEELDWCKREKTPLYAKWQAKDGDTVIIGHLEFAFYSDEIFG